jgi:hypothetical protein
MVRTAKETRNGSIPWALWRRGQRFFNNEKTGGKMEVQIDKLTVLGTEAVQAAIAEYTKYFLVSSIVWIVFGVLCAYTAALLGKRGLKMEDYHDGKMPVLAAATLLLIVGCACIPMNLPTLFSPKAYAIHQLISDAREK